MYYLDILINSLFVYLIFGFIRIVTKAYDFLFTPFVGFEKSIILQLQLVRLRHHHHFYFFVYLCHIPTATAHIK